MGINLVALYWVMGDRNSAIAGDMKFNYISWASFVVI